MNQLVSFKKIVMKCNRASSMAFLAIILLSAETGQAAQLLDKVSVHGFGGWGYGQTDNENQHFLGGWDSDGNADYFNFSLNVRVELSDNITGYLQPAFENINGNSEANVDYVFAEWYLSDVLTIRAGKIKAPIMLLNEVHDVGTVRPFFLLPIGIYGDSTAENYQGAGLTGVFSLGFESDWQLSYDLFGGFTDIYEEINKQREGGNEVYRWTVDKMLGGRLFVQPPIDGLRFGVSGYTGNNQTNITTRGRNIQFDDGDVYAVGGSIEYLTDRWELRSEYLFLEKDEPTAYDDEYNATETALGRYKTYYAEAAYRITEHWQLAARYEVLDYTDGFKIESPDYPFKESKEFTLGLNYWVRPNLVVKCSATFIQGNNNVHPEADAAYWQTEDKNDLEEETVLGLFGVQFSF